MAHTLKLVQTLAISYLKAEFYVGDISTDGTVKHINKLKEACDNGTLLSRMKESAELYHAGELRPVVAAMKACLASYKVNIKKTAQPINLTVEQLRIETLTEFLNSLTGTTQRKTVYGSAAADGRAKWNLTDEEVESMHGNKKLLLSTRDCMQSWRTKNVSCLTKLDANYELKCAIRDRLLTQEARINVLLSETKTLEPTLSTKLTDKLKGGKAAMLSKEEIDMLKKLLG